MGSGTQKLGGPEKAPPFDPKDRVGEVIDERYRLLRFIGRGGMGSVYRAEHIRIRKSVAIKLVDSSIAQTKSVALRFQREAYAIGRISHPNCVSVSDFGELKDGSLYLVMDFVDGESLGDLLHRDTFLPPPLALAIVEDILHGLGHAHEKGIVHRDVKPDNILLSRTAEGEKIAKLLDFGIAKISDHPGTPESPRLTEVGIAFGTPTYLAPEQALGKPSDPRTDLYTVTVMLFEMLTGDPPYESDDNQELLGLHVSAEIPTLHSAKPAQTFSPELEFLIQKGLAKQAEHRFQSAQEYIEAIENILQVQPTEKKRSRMLGKGDTFSAASGSGDEKVPRIAAKTKRQWAVTAAVVGAVAAVFAMVALPSIDEDENTPRAVKQKTPESIATKAARARENGSLSKSLEVLEGADLEKDAFAQMQLGHTFAATHKYKNAIDAYRKSLLLESGLYRNAELVANLNLMIDDNGTFFPQAAELLLRFSSAAEKRKVQTQVLQATVSPKRLARVEAAKVANAFGFADKIDHFARAVLDLEQGKTCKARRAAVAQLRALQDPRAISALKKAKVRRVGRSKRNTNKCLIRAADDAVSVLKSR